MNDPNHPAPSIPAPTRTASGQRINTKIVRAMQAQEAAVAEALQACERLSEGAQKIDSERPPRRKRMPSRH